MLQSLALMYVSRDYLEKHYCQRGMAEMFSLNKVPSGVTCTEQCDNERYMCSFLPALRDNKSVLLCEGPMGSGKTHRIIEALGSKAFPCKRVLVIVCRQSFCTEKAADFAQVLPGLRNYQDAYMQSVYHWSQVPRLVVQVESLHRLGPLPPSYDVVGAGRDRVHPEPVFFGYHDLPLRLL